MFRRSRRVLPLLLPAVMALGLTSCGDDEGAAASDELSQITVEGEAGEEPKVDFGGKVEVDELTTDVLTEGDGDEVAEGDQVLTHIWLGNGFTEKKAFSTYDAGQPERITVDEANLSKIFLEGIEGQTVGSRVLVAAPAEDAFGEQGNPQLGIGNKDSVVVVIDLVELYEPPAAVDVPASEMPKLVEEKGEPVGFDFKGLPKPKADDDLRRTVLEEGDGEEVTTDMTLKVDYLGSVYDAKKPFDESYSKKPAEFALTGVVEGWTYGLEGVTVGSRVLLAIPPALGYGEQAQADIPANSTLYFVVDVISAK